MSNPTQGFASEQSGSGVVGLLGGNTERTRWERVGKTVKMSYVKVRHIILCIIYNDYFP